MNYASGGEGQACRTGGVCDVGLYCNTNICQKPPCQIIDNTQPVILADANHGQYTNIADKFACCQICATMANCDLMVYNAVTKTCNWYRAPVLSGTTPANQISYGFRKLVFVCFIFD